MEITRTLAQEGTVSSAGHSDVPARSPMVDDGGETGAGMLPATCPAVTDVLSRIGDKWSMQVVMQLGGGSLRFNQLRREIDGISQRMLTRTLRGLERDGLVSRTVTPSVPPRVDYELTTLGQSLREPVARLGEWAIANKEAVADARSQYDLRVED